MDNMILGERMNIVQYALMFIVLPGSLQLSARHDQRISGIKVKPIYQGTYTSAEFQKKKSADQAPTSRAGANPSIGHNFTPYNMANARGNLVFEPNNPTGDVGLTQYIFSSYGVLRSFNKVTGLPDGILDINGSVFAPSSSYDPWLLHNRFVQRWFLTYDLANVAGQVDTLNFQVSNESTVTPDTQWAYYQIPGDQINPLGGGGNANIDFEQPAYDQNATYNSVGTFNSTSTFIGSSLTVIPTQSFVDGTPSITVFPGLFPQIVGQVAEGFAAVATNFDSNPTYGYYISPLYDQPAGIQGNQIGLYRIVDAGTTSPSLGTVSPVIITLPFSFAFNGITAQHQGNLFGSIGLMQITAPIFQPVVRNKQLYFSLITQIDSTGTANTAGDRTGILWFQFDVTGDTTGRGLGVETVDTIPVLIQSGLLYDDSVSNPLFYYMPALAVNAQGDLIISFCSSGVDAYINACYAFRSASDTPGELRAPVYVTNSTFTQNFNENKTLAPGPNVQRWGDQATAVVDFTNDHDFWLTQSFSALLNAPGMQTTQVIPA